MAKRENAVVKLWKMHNKRYVYLREIFLKIFPAKLNINNYTNLGCRMNKKCPDGGARSFKTGFDEFTTNSRHIGEIETTTHK